LAPRRTSPLSGSSSPSSSRSIVVFPEPFGPIRPTRSPRITRTFAFDTTCFGPNALDTPLVSITICPGALAGVGLQAHRARLLTAAGPFAPHRHQRTHTAFVACAPGLDPLPQPRLFFSQLLVELRVLHRFGGERGFLVAHERCVVTRATT
jgi:hypothetical protein